MASKPAIPLCECVKSDISLQDWTASVHGDFNFSSSDVEKSIKLATDAKPSVQAKNIHQEIQKKLKDQNNLSIVGAVCELSENRFLAWGCTPPDDVTFYIVDSTNENVASLKVPYNVHGHIEGYIQAYRGSCRPPLRNTVDFGYWMVPATDHVIVMGPGETNPMEFRDNFRNGCKLINYHHLTVEEFGVDLPTPHNKEGRAAIAALTPDPRPGHENEATMICHTACANMDSDGVGGVLGFPTRYSFKDKTVKAIFTEKVMFGKFLQYLKGGQQVATLEHEEYDDDYQNKLPQKIWIFDTDTLTPLFTILHTCLDDVIIPMYSEDQRHLAVVSSGYELAVYKQRVNISRCPEGNNEGGKKGLAAGNILDIHRFNMFIVEVSRNY